MSVKDFIIAVLIVLTTAYALFSQTGNYAEWPSKKAIVLNTTADGAGVAQPALDFPVLIRLNPGNFDGFAHTLNEGADIRFSNADGVSLPYEIERWVDNAGNNDTAEIWVLVDSVAGDAVTTLYMHYGKTGVSGASSPSDVFSSTSGFRFVWHCNGPGESVRGADAIEGKTPVVQAASVGMGYHFDVGDYLKIDDIPALDMGDSFTVSLWMRYSGASIANFHRILSRKSSWDASSGWEFEWEENEPTKLGFLGSGSKHGIFDNVSTNWLAGEWHYVTLTVAADNVRAYSNGSYASSTEINPVVDNDLPLYVMAVNGFTEHAGSLDEIRLAPVIRSEDWIKLSYMNQRPVDALVTITEVMCDQAAITSEPANQTVAPGETAAFSVSASGEAPLLYQWQQSSDGTVWAEVGSDADSYSIANVQSGNTGLRIRCIVSNRCGGDTSAVAILAVSCPQIAFMSQPQNATVTFGENAEFSCTAEGAVTYSWERSDDNGNTWVGLSSAATSITIASAGIDDDGALIRCIVRTECALDTSQIASLTVHCSQPVISANPVDIAVDEENEASFTVQATGTNLAYQWQRSPDGVSWSDITGATAASYSLTVSLDDHGAAFRCRVSNVCGAAAASEAAALTVRNVIPPAAVGSLTIAMSPNSASLRWPTPESSSPDADSVWVVYDESGFVHFDSSGGQRLGEAMTAGAGTQQKTIAGLSSGQAYTFSLWVVDVAGNAALVDSVTRVTPSAGDVGNPLSLSAVALDSTRVRLSVGGYGDVNHSPDNGLAYADSIALWVEPDTFPASPDRQAQTVFFFAIDSLQSQDGVFNTELTVAAGADSFAYFAASLIWRQTPVGDSIPPFTDASAVRVRMIEEEAAPPVNRVTLTVSAQSPREVSLSWTTADSVRIWYGNAMPPLGEDLTGAGFDLIQPPRGSTEIIADGLTPNKTYWFGLELFDGAWSYVSQSARDSARTLVLDSATIVENRIQLTTLAFDSTSSNIRVSLLLDTTGGFDSDSLVAGVGYGLTDYPESDTGLQWVRLNSIDTTVSLVLDEDLLFNHDYFVAVWLQRGGGEWSAPTDQSRKSIRTPSFTRQPVSFWPDDDTIATAANGKIILKKGERSEGETIDTVAAHTPQRLDSLGFVPVGQGFTFIRKLPTAPLVIGVRIDSTKKELVDAARIYRDSMGVMLVERESYVADSIVWIETNDLRFPFLALADTVSPSAIIDTAATDTSEPVFPKMAVRTKMSFADNVGNVAVKLKYGQGNSVYRDSVDTLLGGVAQDMVFTVPAALVNGHYGVRAKVFISDGVHRDSIDISRQVVIDTADQIPLLEREWIPVRATAELSDISFASAFAAITGAEEEWEYDNTRFRLFRWDPGATKQATSGSWVEYSPEREDHFSLKPGAVLWAKAAESATMHTGAGVSASLKKPVTITLKPGSWSDFAMPYKFDVFLGDILDATGPDGDSLQMYRWTKSEGGYVARELYIAGVDALQESRNTAVLGYGVHQDAFTVYNPLQKEVELAIPPMPDKLSKYASEKQAKKTGGRACDIQVAVSSAVWGELNTVRCGTGPAPVCTYFPLAPSFKKAGAGLGADYDSALAGHVAFPAVGDGKRFPVTFFNSANTVDTLTFRLAAKTLPAEVHAAILGGAEPDDSVLIIPARGQAKRFLAIGDADYIASSARTLQNRPLGIARIVQRRTDGAIVIQASIPRGGVNAIRIRLYDSRGRTIRQTDAGALRQPGVQSLALKGRSGLLGPGVYIVRIEASLPDGREKCIVRQMLAPQ